MKKKENSKKKVGIYLTPARHALSHAILECDPTIPLYGTWIRNANAGNVASAWLGCGWWSKRDWLGGLSGD